MEIIIGWIIFSILVGVYWNSKGRSGVGGFFVSLALSPLIGFIIGVVMKPDIKTQEKKALGEGGMQKCPYCAELVKREAILCRYCGKELLREKKSAIVADEKGKFICPNCNRVLWLVHYTNKQEVVCRYCRYYIGAVAGKEK